jgi:hypothetical protein
LGVLSATIAGLSALGLLAMGGIALLGGAVMGIELGTPIRAFSVVAITLASGFAVGFLSVGIPIWQYGRPARAAGLFMLLGGGLLLVPVVGELARIGFGVDWPLWVVLPIIGLVSLDTLAIGINLRLATPVSESPNP